MDGPQSADTHDCSPQAGTTQRRNRARHPQPKRSIMCRLGCHLRATKHQLHNNRNSQLALDGSSLHDDLGSTGPPRSVGCVIGIQHRSGRRSKKKTGNRDSAPTKQHQDGGAKKTGTCLLGIIHCCHGFHQHVAAIKKSVGDCPSSSCSFCAATFASTGKLNVSDPVWTPTANKQQKRRQRASSPTGCQRTRRRLSGMHHT